eukprot:gb/GEZN01001762.1/.p1 GENE.gb/GEZN01001762.1/~~gb/GEZN01001762.1/.p1  ORF type:complete len:904 (-),score=50.82 gb/GEZN01001762.1/:102-2813(-)
MAARTACKLLWISSFFAHPGQYAAGASMRSNFSTGSQMTMKTSTNDTSSYLLVNQSTVWTGVEFSCTSRLDRLPRPQCTTARPNLHELPAHCRDGAAAKRTSRCEPPRSTPVCMHRSEVQGVVHQYSDWPARPPPTYTTTWSTRECTMESCWNFTRCLAGQKLKVYFYPSRCPQAPPYTRDAAILLNSSSFEATRDPEQACILVVFNAALGYCTWLPQTQWPAQIHLTELSHWRDGQNHIIYDSPPHDFNHPHVGETTGQAVNAHTGHTESSFRRKFDIQLPMSLYLSSFSRKVTTRRYEHRVKNVHFKGKRDLLISFKGRYSVMSMGLPWEVDRYIALACWDSPNVTVHLKCDDSTYSDVDMQNFKDLILRSRFCFAAGSEGAFSQRLSEILLLGCVPLVTEDMILPFEGYLNWSAAVLFVPVKSLATVPAELAARERAQPEEVARMQSVGSKYVDTCFLTPSHELMCALATVKQNLECSSATRQGPEVGVGQSLVTTQARYLKMPDKASWNPEWGTIRPIYTGPPSAAPCPGLNFQPGQPGKEAAKLQTGGYYYSTRWGNVLSPYWMRRSVAYLGGASYSGARFGEEWMEFLPTTYPASPPANPRLLEETCNCYQRWSWEFGHECSTGWMDIAPLIAQGTRYAFDQFFKQRKQTTAEQFFKFRPTDWVIYDRCEFLSDGHGTARLHHLDTLPSDSSFRIYYVTEPEHGNRQSGLTHVKLRQNALRLLISLLEDANLTEYGDTIAKLYRGNVPPPLTHEQLSISIAGDRGSSDTSICQVYQGLRDLWLMKNRPKVSIVPIERTHLWSDFARLVYAPNVISLWSGSSWTYYSLLANTGNVYMVSKHLSTAVSNNHTLPINIHLFERESPEVKGLWSFKSNLLSNENFAQGSRSVAQLLKWLAS